MRQLDNDHAAVRLEGVSKAFGNKRVLADVSLQISDGEAFCLLGKSGIGKSITLKLMIGLLKPDQGHILIEGNDITTLEPSELAEVRKKMGFLFQNAALFDSITVNENVAFPIRRHTNKSEDEIQSIVREKLQEVHLDEEGERMPAELSGGMRKRAGLARALALEPGILLVDEPSSGLDRITASEIYDLLLQLKQKQKVTLVVVTHDVIGARHFADRFAVLDQGKVAACGAADEISRSSNPLVRELALGSET